MTMLHVVISTAPGTPGRPVAFVTRGDDGVEASRFGARMIHDSLAEVYERRPVTIDMHGHTRTWSAWLADGCPVAWTDDRADQACIGPVVRFGEVGGVDQLRWRYMSSVTYRLRGVPPVNSYAASVLLALREATA